MVWCWECCAKNASYKATPWPHQRVHLHFCTSTNARFFFPSEKHREKTQPLWSLVLSGSFSRYAWTGKSSSRPPWQGSLRKIFQQNHLQFPKIALTVNPASAFGAWPPHCWQTVVIAFRGSHLHTCVFFMKITSSLFTGLVWNILRAAYVSCDALIFLQWFYCPEIPPNDLSISQTPKVSSEVFQTLV